MQLRIDVGNNIRRLRNEKDMTKRYLARETGMDPSNLTKVESGKQSISVDLIEKIAQVLEIEPYILLARNSNSEVDTPPETIEYTVRLLKKALDALNSIRN